MNDKMKNISKNEVPNFESLFSFYFLLRSDMVMIKRLTLATNSVESSGDPTGSFDVIGYKTPSLSLRYEEPYMDVKQCIVPMHMCRWKR